jgi:hypothetical protein
MDIYSGAIVTPCYTQNADNGDIEMCMTAKAPR